LSSEERKELVELRRQKRVAVTCRVLEVSTSGYYQWRRRPARRRAVEKAHLMNTIRDSSTPPTAPTATDECTQSLSWAKV
jgi:hypothetical protein